MNLPVTSVSQTMTLKVLLAFLIFAATFVNGAKILGVFPRSSKSHHILGCSLLKALAQRGHQVTMLSPFPLKETVENYEDIHLTGLENFHEENDVIKKYLEQQNTTIFNKIKLTMTAMNTFNEQFLSHTAVKDLLASNRTYDLVIQYWFGSESFLGIANHFGAPVIAFSTIGATFLTNSISANPTPYSYVSTMVPLFPDEMNFFQRCINTISNILLELLYHLYTVPRQEALRQKYFPKAPPAKELRSNISLVFLNSHYSIESPRPYVPSMIQIGGLHIEEAKELKGDLKEFMDNAVEGVMFFSLGSNVKMSDLPKDKLQAIIATFAKVPLKVLWKSDVEEVQNVTSNVKIGKWLPQRDILAHPNIKLFVTHGGLLSTIEAVYNSVPVVGIPIFGDQESNVDDSVNKGCAVKVAFRDLSEDTLTKAVNVIISNPKYRENVKQRSLVLKDQPMKPLDNAIFWVEYVLRHKGAHHLKTSALKLEWYQYYLLDVISFFIGIFITTLMGCFIILYLLFKLFIKMFTKIYRGSWVNISQKKKNI